LIVFYLASYRPTVESAAAAFIVGYLDDILSGGLIGAGAFSLVVTFAFIYIISRRVEFSNAPAKVLFTALASVINTVSAYLVWRFINPDIALFTGGFFITAALSAIFAPTITNLFARISRSRTVSIP
ncbi:MAG: rod shape-determining protein MreD, partial [Deltaproteobacteria bacterium]|nr:rod shape-determining protein MreD [Deltaproteobacteria bacterium]